jgi:hypothetical protein
MFYVRTTPHTHKGNRRRGAGRLVALLLMLPTLAVLGAQASPAAATSELCEGDVKVEVQGETNTITYTAPDGYLVSSWCVKSGTEAEVHDVDPPAKTITIAHSSGKGISHYSVTLVKAPEPKAPAAATAVDVCEPATGPTNDRITIPTDANFTYTVDGVAVAAGQFVATGTSHTVVAVPKAGVVVQGGATTTWTFTFTKVLCVAPPPVTPPTVTPPVVAPPEVLPEEAFGKAVGSVKTSCQGTVRAKLSNRSGRTVTYKLRVGKKVHQIAVRSLTSKKYVTQGRALARVVLKVNGTRLDQTRIPARCQAPEVLPDTGLRATSS